MRARTPTFSFSVRSMEPPPARVSQSEPSDHPVLFLGSVIPSIGPPLPSDSCPELIPVEPRVQRILRPQPWFVDRRIAKRLLFGVAALGLLGTWAWIDRQPPLKTIPSTLRGSIESSDSAASREPIRVITDSETKSQIPAWYSPEILYFPMSAPPPAASIRVDVPLPTPRPTPR
jgi:hypothetical protein